MIVIGDPRLPARFWAKIGWWSSLKLDTILARARWHKICPCCAPNDGTQLFNDYEKRRLVTIIAGFPITGFVLLGADAEEGGGYAKSSVRKIATIDDADYKCLIGGAG